MTGRRRRSNGRLLAPVLVLTLLPPWARPGPEDEVERVRRALLSPGRHRYHEGQPVRIERTVTGGHVLTGAGGGATRVRRLD